MTNCKLKCRRPDGLFPFVLLKSHVGEQYPMAESFPEEVAKLYEAREQRPEAKRQRASLSPQRDRGHPVYLPNASEHPASTKTGLPPQTSPSVLPRTPVT